MRSDHLISPIHFGSNLGPSKYTIENVFWAYPTQHWLKQRMDEMEKVCTLIAHNRMLLPAEFQRLYMYISDWNRVVGL